MELINITELEEMKKITKELKERLDAAIELLDNIHDGHSYYFDENDLRQLNYINGSDRYYIEEDDIY